MAFLLGGDRGCQPARALALRDAVDTDMKLIKLKKFDSLALTSADNSCQSTFVSFLYPHIQRFGLNHKVALATSHRSDACAAASHNAGDGGGCHGRTQPKQIRGPCYSQKDPATSVNGGQSWRL